MTTYVDSSALVPVYVPERFSKAARRALRSSPQVPFTSLHGLEVPNAFALLLGRGLIRDDECRAIRTQLQDDIDAQRLVPLALDWDRVFASACELQRTIRSNCSPGAWTFSTWRPHTPHIAACSFLPTTVSSPSRRRLA